MFTFGKATHLLVLDFEATGLDVRPGADELAEVGAILVAADSLHELASYTRVIPVTQPALDRLLANDFLVQMHEANGLLPQLRVRTVDAATHEAEVAGVETDLLAMLADFNVAPGKVAIAGSGIATFDLPIIKALMPKLSAAALYYPADIGIVRRFAEMAGAPISAINEAKTHRSIDDARCHLAEIEYFLNQFASLSHA